MWYILLGIDPQLALDYIVTDTYVSVMIAWFTLRIGYERDTEE